MRSSPPHILLAHIPPVLRTRPPDTSLRSSHPQHVQYELDTVRRCMRRVIYGLLRTSLRHGSLRTRQRPPRHRGSALRHHFTPYRHHIRSDLPDVHSLRYLCRGSYVRNGALLGRTGGKSGTSMQQFV